MKTHRIYTLFRNLALALPSVLLSVLGHPLALLTVMFVFAAAVVLALVFPVRQDEPIGGGLMMGWGRWAEFSCTTTESDFLKFASARGYGLATNSFVNVNQAVNPTMANRGWECASWHQLPEPKRYLTYENICGNGGGITLVFDPGTGILRGHYSSN